MDATQLQRLKPEFDSFLDRYVPLFGHEGNGGQARRFVQGLLLGGDRRSAENIAEAVGGGVVRSLQKFLGQGRWDGDAVLHELQRHVTEVLGVPDAVLNVDETGFPKKGTKSVGVKRQYAGCLGRTDNCQVGVFVNYFTATNHTLIDRRLFVPEEWAADGPRREEAGIPKGLVFRTKPELALEMVQAAVARDMPFRWVTADSVYGESPTFVQGVRGLGKWYVVDVGCDARVWLEEPQMIPAGTKGDRGRPSAHPKAATKPVRVDVATAQLPESAWRRLVVAEGSQGPRLFDYAWLWVWFSEEGLPSGRERLLVRRSISQTPEVKYHRTNAPEELTLDQVACIRGCHWSVEQSFEAGKGECGLDEYETRGWVGWHHHITLSLLAQWFLVLQRQRPGEKKRGGAERTRDTGRARASAGAA